MSETEATPRPRRSAREKKQSQQYSTDNSQSPNKRKRLDTDTDVTDDDAPSGPEEIPGNDSDASDGYVAPRKPAKVPGKATFKPPRQTAPRKPRGGKTAAKTTTRRPRKAGPAKSTSGQNASADAKISDDNALFNSIMNPSAALQATVEDFLESFGATPQLALADLINCILRTCGSNNSVDSDSVVDYDGVVSALDDFTEVLKENEAPTYPLVSKHPMFKKFRKSLSEFLSRLVKSSADLGSLYTSDLVITIQAWVVAMSSSQLRSFRHTATVIALEIEAALCTVAAAVEKEAETVTRQRDGERKRKAKGAGSAREKDLEEKAADVKERRSKLADYLKDLFDSVFVHRYRDLDPSIRAECVQAIGKWLKEFPAYFLEGQYLRYIGWVLSDSNTQVRLEAVKSLVPLYGMDDYIVSLQSFTDRFKGRLVEMATSDAELSVRVAVIQVLSSIDRQGLLEEEQRSTMCLLIFDAEPKVRRAVSGFVSGVWQEVASERLVGKRKSDETEKNRAGLKALAQLFVRWGRVLDKKGAEGGEENWDGDSSSQGESSSSQRDISVAVSSRQKGRIGLAVEALWDEIEVISDWDTMCEFLLLDHSASQEDPSDGSPVSAARRKKSRKATNDPLVDEAWRLEEVEEAVLLEILVSSLRKAEMEAATAAKKSEEPVSSEITRDLIKTLPSLIAKHQTDENRIANVLLIPELMNMDMYLEMRMITAYEALWDDITKQFLSHSSQLVLTNCVAAIRHLMGATSLSNTNSTKILELEDELATSLRDVVAGRDELEVSTFSDDEVLALSAICARISSLAGIRDLTAWMNEDEGGKQSSAWTIICALAERGRLGYKEEMQMVDRALQLLSVHIIWKSHNVIQNAGALEDSELQENLREERDLLLEKLIEYALGTQSNALLSVRRTAFQNLLTLQTLFSTPPDVEDFPLTSLTLSMSDEMQYRCAGFVQAEIERFADELEGDRPERPEGSDAGAASDSGSDAEARTTAPKGRRKKKGENAEEAPPIPSKARLEEEYVFTATIATFLRAIRAGVIHTRHGAVLLTHFGRLGPSFDLSAKILVDILREEGMYKDNGSLVVEIIVQALKDAFTLVVDNVVDSEQHVVALAKALAHCVVIRGAQLSVVRRLPSQYVIEIHTTLVSWTMKRISAYESNKNKKMRARSTLFFRALVPLLSAIESRDALQIEAHLDHEVSALKLEVPPTSKSWEPFHAYEKRLLSAQSKEKGTKKGKGKALPGVEAVTTDDDDDIEVEDLVEVNGVSSQVNDVPAAASTPPPPTRRVRPQPRSVFRKRTTESVPSEDETLRDEDGALPEPPAPESPVTNGRLHSPAGSIHDASQEPASSPNPSPVKPSKKRTRAESNAGSETHTEMSGRDSAEEPTQGNEIVVKRKRARH